MTRPGFRAQGARRLRLLWMLAALGMAVSLVACSPAAAPPAGPGSAPATAVPADADPMTVVASTSVWGDIAAQVGGEHVSVTSLIGDPSQDPHEFQPSGRDALALSRASVIVVNGGGYDDVLVQMLDSVGRSATVVTAVTSAADVPTVESDNEHVWFDLDASAAVADAIAAALGERNPRYANEFRANAAEFDVSLDPIRLRLSQISARHGGTPVAVTEPLPLYLVQAAGLRDVTPETFREAMEEGTDASPSDMARVLDLFADHIAKLLMYNEQSASAQAEQVWEAARANGIPVLPLAEVLPKGQSYQTWLAGIVDRMADLLDGETEG